MLLSIKLNWTVLITKCKQLIKNGTDLVLGGHKLDRAGFFYEPTILDNVKKDDSAFKEEIFGPVLAITTYNDFDEELMPQTIQMQVYLLISFQRI